MANSAVFRDPKRTFTVKRLGELPVELDVHRVRQHIERIIKAAPQIEADAIWHASKAIYKATQDRVPVKSGKLKKSGRRAVARKGDTINVYITYGHQGSGAERYALAIHEHPTNVTYSPGKRLKPKGIWFTRPGGEPKILDYTKDGTGDKYVEKPLNEGKEKYLQDVAKYVKRELAKIGSGP